MHAALIHPPIEGPLLHFRLSVEQYEAMMRDGTIAEGDPYELLDGQVVRKLRNAAGENPVTIGFDHATCVKKLAKLSPRLAKAECHLATQQPITLTDFDVPEPDGSIIRGSIESLAKLRRHPESSEVLCAIEVADASLARDRGYKLLRYAHAMIPQYVILNLIDRVAEVYTDPIKGTGKYARAVTLLPNDKLTLRTLKGPGLTVTVKSLLP